MADNLVYAIRGSTGFSIKKGLESPTTLFTGGSTPKEIGCRVFEFSKNGRYFAFCDSTKTVLLEVNTGRIIATLPLPRTVAIAFSPLDTYVMFWEPYVTYVNKADEQKEQKAEPNLRIYNTETGEHVTTFVAQKQSQWKPVFSDNEKIMIRHIGSELLVHKDDKLFESCAFKNSFPKMEGFELSPGGAQYIAIFTPTHGAAAGQVQVRRLDPKFSVINTKSFFKGDKASMIWNSKGTAVLIHATVEVDSTNQSYYGQSTVYLINVVTGSSSQISLSKNGPVYSVRWNPNGIEFAVCYGFMPAKVTTFNFRGDPTFDMEEGAKNDIHYNSLGNILLVVGFGNLSSGKMEVWDVENKKLLNMIEVPNTTLFQWAPDGRHFLTATTTPRLRIDNNYRFWNYYGKMLAEVKFNSPAEELWQIQFRPLPSSAISDFKIVPLTKEQKLHSGLLIKAKNGDDSASVPAGALRKAGAYVPPHLRTAPTNGNSVPKGALVPQGAATKTVLSETEKKIRNLQRKLDDIAKLKARQAKGDKLELNQVDKINKEAEMLADLEALQLTA